MVHLGQSVREEFGAQHTAVANAPFALRAPSSPGDIFARQVHHPIEPRKILAVEFSRGGVPFDLALVFGGMANQGMHLMPLPFQQFSQSGPDETGGARNQDLHSIVPPRGFPSPNLSGRKPRV
jgi:hypothetical protein